MRPWVLLPWRQTISRYPVCRHLPYHAALSRLAVVACLRACMPALLRPSANVALLTVHPCLGSGVQICDASDGWRRMLRKISVRRRSDRRCSCPKLVGAKCAAKGGQTRTMSRHDVTIPSADGRRCCSYLVMFHSILYCLPSVGFWRCFVR